MIESREASKRKLEKVLKALKKEMESHYVVTIDRIKDEARVFGGKKEIFISDDINFKIYYIPETEGYRLETSFSNQIITEEWIDKLNRIRKIIGQA